MRIKNIELQNNAFFGNVEFNFTDNSGQIMDTIVLAGENGCGKTQLLNIIYDFSNISLDGDVSNEKRIFTLELSQYELQQINYYLKDSNKLSAPTGEMEITIDFQFPPNDYSRIKASYQSKADEGIVHTEHINSLSFFLNANIKSLFITIFSTVEINYSPKDTSSVTAKEIDEKVTVSVISGKDLATDIQQLLIDIDDNDAHELQAWVESNDGKAPPREVCNKRINRFENAFAMVFDNLNFSRIVTGSGKKKVYFKKGEHDVDIVSLSSGEKQIVFRGAFLLKDQQSTKGLVVLIDEPEISLHPIWQAKIFDYYRMLFTEADGTQTSQLFIATHSQYVLRSALDHRSNTLIVLLKHTGSSVDVKRITAPLVLPSVTSAELNYVAFDIPSNDYHIELYGHLQNKIALRRGNTECSVKECDTYITQQTDYNLALHRKPSTHGTVNYETLPTYIRNAIDHPDPSRTFTSEELRNSIELLIKLC